DQVLTCTTTSVTLTATASSGATLVWSPGGQTTASITVNAAGTYIVTATAANGCTATDAAVVTLNNTPPTVNAGRDTVIGCSSSSVTLTATASSGATLLWSNGQTTASITVTVAGTYTVTATGTNGCTASDVVNVGLNTPPVASCMPGCILTCLNPTMMIAVN